jgi:putative DNA primase/helicase
MSNTDRLRAIADIAAGAPILAGETEHEAESEADVVAPLRPPPGEAAEPDVLSWLAELEQNDTDNGKRLMTHFGEDLLHVRESGWHVWTGRLWQRAGGDEAVTKFAQRTAKRIHLEADYLGLWPHEQQKVRQAEALLKKPESELTEADKNLIDEAKDIREELGARRAARRKFATSSGNDSRIKAMVAQALPHNTIPPEDLDADGNLFNCNNVTLQFAKVEDDRFAGSVPRYMLKVTPVKHSRSHMITRIAPVDYDPQAQCPRWNAALTRFQPDPEIRKFLQIYHGIALTNDISQQCFVFNWGGGANGKSTMMEALGELFGTYSDTLNAESISGQGQRRGDQATPDFAGLGGVRYLRVAELPRGEPLREALIKMLTGGDKMKVRHLNKGFFDLASVFKAVMSGNDMPQISGVDLGIWRRTKLVPWKFIIPEEERRPMKDILREFGEERSGILNWLLDGLDLYYREGLKTPAAVAAATDSYRSEMDPVGAFLSACVNKEKGSSVTAREMYLAFYNYCEANSIRPWRETMFGRVMPQKGFERDMGRVRRYLDVALHDVPQPPPKAPRSPPPDDEA